ncbi:MAG: MogA/MoaB family molybdenum cofactor biosynthesis protein [Planctomycetota bacterium]|nr:MogA/MoaB family molybdenum cofactor biosynthesis protein [Planctomycetota bacterium]
MSVEEHKARSAELKSVRCAVVTVSDTRTLETDESGVEIARLLEEHGHRVIERSVVPDEPGKISLVLRHWLGCADVDAAILNGGTGIAKRDGTVEAVRQFLDTELPGFGELFRYLSYQQVGASAMLSRSFAGIASGKLVFALPGSRKAVKLAMERLILPELRHLVYELRK